MTVEFRVLGPLLVRHEGAPIVLRSARQRCLLAILILDAGRPVPASTLCAAMWGADVPPGARAALHSHVARLRRALGPAGTLLRTSGEAYVLEVDPLACDVHRFRRRVRNADSAADLRSALALWRGTALADIGSAALEPSAAALEEERLDALERCITAELATSSRPTALVSELSELVARHPLRETFWAQLMTALARSGRQADALSAYQQVRGTLRDELGVDPGAELVRAHELVLAGDSRAEVAESKEPEQSWQPQQQLPIDVSDFIGRDGLADEMVSALREREHVPMVVVSGLAGAGKSALATNVAHRVAADFPDGQWYLELGGGSGDPREPGHLLDRMLRTAGVAPSAIPDDLAERAGVLRARLSGRRVLLVLDDAAGDDQVLPLLPGTPGCAVIVTSRRRLPSLVVRVGAQYVPLAGLTDDASRELLTSFVGAARVAGPGGDDLVRLCGNLPLALRVAGAHLAHRPEIGLERYNARLRRNRLAELTVDGAAGALPEAFDMTLAALPADAVRAFDLWGAAPGGELPGGALAALLGTDDDEADRTIERLCDAHLATRTAADRFGMHDLVRDHARARVDHASASVRDAVHRMIGWYLDTVEDANAAAHFRVTVRLPHRDGDAGRFTDAASARRWLETELLTLVAAAQHAAEHGPVDLSWRLTDALRVFLDVGLHLNAWQALNEASLPAAEAAGDDLAVAAMYHSAGHLAANVGDRSTALDWHDRALSRYRAAGDVLGEAVVHNNVGVIHSHLSEFARAAEHQSRAAALFAAAGRPDLEAYTLANRSAPLIYLGRLDEAIESASVAVASDNMVAVLVGLLNRADAYGCAGRWQDGYADAQAALERSLESGHVEGLVSARCQLARRSVDMGRIDDGVRYATQALRLARQAVLVRVGEAEQALALANRMRGRPQDAVDGAERSLDPARPLPPELAVGALVSLAGALHAAGDYAASDEAADRAVRLGDDRGQRIDLCRALGVRAASARCLGRPDDADRDLARAVELIRACGFVPSPSDVGLASVP